MKQDELEKLYQRLDESVEEAEALLDANGLGVEASVRIPDLDGFACLVFRRTKDGWQLMFEWSPANGGGERQAHPLLSVSRYRKAHALKQLGALIAETKRNANELGELMKGAIEHVSSCTGAKS